MRTGHVNRVDDALARSSQLASDELGDKGKHFDGASHIQLTAFVYQYEDLQATCSEPGSPVVVVCNAGTVDGRG